MKFACLDVLRNVLLQVFLYTCRQEVCFGITHNEWLIGGGCESELRVITHLWGFWGRVLKEFLPSSSNRLHAYPNSLPQSCWAGTPPSLQTPEFHMALMTPLVQWNLISPTCKEWCCYRAGLIYTMWVKENEARVWLKLSQNQNRYTKTDFSAW